MDLKSSLHDAIGRLKAAHVPSPRMNAELLLMFTLGCDRAYLYAHPERELTSKETELYNSALSRRETGVPAQYITGHQEFWGLDFIVSPAVLIPRPETELVVETTLNLAKSIRSSSEPLRIVDVGTGSGCIAIALAKELPQAEIHATDISTDALELAQANAARHGPSFSIDRGTPIIQFGHADLLEGINFAYFDFVVSNPPYVGESEEDQVQLEVRKFEPRQAVFAGPTGLEVIQRLVPQAHRALKPGGWLVMEISGTIADRVPPLLQDWSSVSIANDIQGLARVASAQRSRAAL